MWNVKKIEFPPISNSKTSIKEIDVKFFNNVLKNGIEFFENQQHLHIEAALLSRTIYRMKMKFRSSKDFKAMQKLNKALHIYLQMNISEALNTVLCCFPQKYKPNEIYLPTRNMVDFILARLQGLGKLLCRILETCVITFDLMQERLKLGHFWKVAVIIYSVTARIFIIVKKILKFSCELYFNLIEFSSKLSNLGKQWLPEDYILPNYLSEWLNINLDLDLEKEREIIEIPDDKSVLSYFSLIDDSDDDIEFCEEYVIVNDEPSVCDLEENNDSLEICEVISKVTNQDEPIYSKYLQGFNDNTDTGMKINSNCGETSKSRKRKRPNRSRRS